MHKEIELLTLRATMAAAARVRSVGRHGRVDSGLGWVAPVAELGPLLPDADFVILALPLTRQTHLLIGPGEFARMRRHAWLINLGRGTVVDESARRPGAASAPAARGALPPAEFRGCRIRTRGWLLCIPGRRFLPGCRWWRACGLRG